MRRLAIVAALVGGSAGRAHAQGVVTYTPELDPDRFVLTSDPLSVGELDGARPLASGNFALGLAMRVGAPPLQVCVQDGSGACAQDGNLVRTRVGADLVAAFGFGRFGAYAQLPVILNQGSDFDPAGARIQSAGLADLRVGGKALLLQRGDHGLGADVRLALPTGGGDDFTGDGGVSTEARLIYDWRRGRYGAVAQAGYAWRQDASRIANLYVDDELLWGVAGQYWVRPEKLVAAISAFGRIGLRTDPMTMQSPGEEEMPAEVMASGRWWAATHWIAEVGAGMGVTDGYGAPAFRVLAGVRWIRETPFEKPHPKTVPVVVLTDRDGDGIFDKDDACPDDPEDKDGFEDSDGCPEADNDKDTILDKDDSCPMAPEDLDGFEDANGCPDPDNDADGLPDVDDKCPNEAEDVDGFEDGDGCPDLDNDHDGVLDGDDKCVDDPETYNGVDDTDGCPDAKPTVVVTDTAVEIKETIYFDLDKATIKAKSYKLLDGVAAAIIAHKLKISVEGHTDDRANDAYNMTLSQKRAEAVREYLIAKGVAAENLTAIGYGETQPKEAGKSEKARAANRRVEFLIILPQSK